MPEASQNTSLYPNIDSPERNIEAYTVVLSVSCHLLAVIAGGSSNIALLLAMAAPGRAGSRHSARGYSQVLTLISAGLVLCLVWCPLEIADLLTWHHAGHHIFSSHATQALKSTLHVFLLAVICAVIVLLALEAALRLVTSTKQQRGSHHTSTFASRWCSAGQGNRLWPPVASLLAVVFAASLAATYLGTTTRTSDQQQSMFYVDIKHRTRTCLLALTSILFCMTLLVGLILLVILLKECVFWEGGRLHFRRRPSVKLVIPDFLISQSTTTAADNAGGYDPSTATPSPSTPKLLAVVGSETAGDEVSPIGDLPTAAKSLGSRLGVNMAQVLGRRRHTICQIGDSSSGAGGGVKASGGAKNDPIGAAKQYGYVRKFSVDISALQAQLQNPKSFKDAPFQSDVDLTKKPSGDGRGQTTSGKPEPLLPLKPLPLKFEAKGRGGGGVGGLGVDPLSSDKSAPKGTPPPALKNGPASPNINSHDTEESQKPSSCPAMKASPVVQTPPQPPPVIMVSNDDDMSNVQLHGDDLDHDDKEHDHSTQEVDETTPLNPDENTTTISINTVATTPQTEDNIDITLSKSTTAAKKPTSLAFKDSNREVAQREKGGASRDEPDSCGNNNMQGATLDSDVSFASADGDDGERATAIRMSQLVLLLTLTFLLALLPVAITELLRSTLKSTTFVNTRACVLAVWALQTLVYPHLLAWGDRNLHRAVRRLKRSFTSSLEDRLGGSTICCPESGESRGGNIEDTSSVSQV
ncbi:hypothetical protein ElyMa_004118800 [Elysia marginata]|uniref:G-protein coupled receptors family 1 profile domain-containing protein n=1 Tax=Elysia marginata TaxID=1093978 RepID=A0AAV4GF24_9GAST|nr:hypothetical protein ElyMa_004118800 [Elysia marginata]